MSEYLDSSNSWHPVRSKLRRDSHQKQACRSIHLANATSKQRRLFNGLDNLKRDALSLVPRNAPHMLKRTIDVVAAIGGLFVLFPVIALTCIAIRMESAGPAIFRQQRVGRAERPFTVYKLRTMRIGTDQKPTHEVSVNAYTRLGRFLRSSKLDEVPQLVNVLRGDMSLVGPRPCLQTQDHLIAERRCRGVHDVRPGITGLAQVFGIDMSEPRKLARVDALYIRKQTVAFDVWLIFRTLARPKARSRHRKRGST